MCTDCNTAVLDIHFSNDFSQIEIDFGVPLIIPSNGGSPTYELCQAILLKETLDKVGGIEARCYI